MIAKLAATLICVAVFGSSAPALAAGAKEAGQTKSTPCIACHGIDGNSVTLLDLRTQYLLRLPHRQSVSVFLEVFNALNKINYGNPTGNRNNANFMVPVEAGTMRSAQMGVRYTF